MSCFCVWLLLGAFFLYGGIAAGAPVSLEETLDKLAGEAVRGFPKLRGNQAQSEYRAELVKRWQSTDAGEIDLQELNELKRRTRDYDGYVWQDLIKRFELANLDDDLSRYLFMKASERSLSAEEFYVLGVLLDERLKVVLEEREERSKERLRLIGKGYTAYVREHKKDPGKIEFCAAERATCFAVDPETGAKVAWIYVGAGPAEIRGGNRYRMVAYSPFKVGRAKDKRWVVYKGGMLGEWKDETVQKHVAAMHLENMQVAREEERKEEEKVKVKRVTKAKPELLITIREIW
ncbi:hypothetical protein ACFPK9_14915 [Rubritalea spongiae]|uniref:Uncharacterized protein n=1 Tax=Rubritalea spongiae TaxID=430797 RepID=A0ABW5DZG6_9BACT